MPGVIKNFYYISLVNLHWLYNTEICSYVPYGGKVWQGDSLVNLLLESEMDQKVRNGFSLTNHA